MQHHPMPKGKPPIPGAPMPDQRSVTDQLRELVKVATKAGLYDAADAVQNLLRPESRLTTAEIICLLQEHK